MTELKITDIQKRLLQRVLVAQRRFPRRGWRLRNKLHHSILYGDDREHILAMAQAGLVVCDRACEWFSATKKGALAIGFKPYQIKKLNFAED